jgi:hypothetical protein
LDVSYLHDRPGGKVRVRRFKGSGSKRDTSFFEHSQLQGRVVSAKEEKKGKECKRGNGRPADASSS